MGSPNSEKARIIAELVNNPESIKAELCRRSFFTFVKEFWPVIIEAEPVFNWHIPYLCSELETLFKSVVNNWTREYDLIANIPPGTTKSTIISVMFNAWAWIARNPVKLNQTGAHLKFLTGSHNGPLSMDHATLCRDIILSDKYKRYFPEMQLRLDSTAKTNYKNTAGGARITTSVGASPTGKHAHFLLVDDPVDPEEALSDVERATANRWCSRTLSTRKVDKRVTVTIIVMQRLHKEDPTGYYLDRKKNIKHIVLPGSIRDKKHGFVVKPPELAKFYKDGLLDPVRMPISVIEELKEELGPYGYAGQVGQDPKAREGAMFQKEWFGIEKAAPAGGTRWVRGWDLAATNEKEAKRGGDKAAYTAGVVMKWAEGKFYIGNASRFRASPNKVRLRMKNVASQDSSNYGEDTIQDFPQDPGQAGKDQARHIAQYLSDYIVKFSPESGDKLLRLEPFASQVEAGNVILIDNSGPGEQQDAWIKIFLDEITFIPNGFFDQADGASRAFKRVNKLRKTMQAEAGGGRTISQGRNWNEGELQDGPPEDRGSRGLHR